MRERLLCALFRTIPRPGQLSRKQGWMEFYSRDKPQQYLMGQYNSSYAQQCEKCPLYSSPWSNSLQVSDTIFFIAVTQPDECQSMPALIQTGPSQQTSSSTSLGIIPEHTLLESCTRLSVSLEENGLFKVRIDILKDYPILNIE